MNYSAVSHTEKSQIVIWKDDIIFCCTHFWQLWQTLETPLTVGRDVVRQEVEQKSAGEPFLWKAVCPFIRLLLQWEQDMCNDEGLEVGCVCVSAAGLTEKTDPILKSSCQ